MVKKKFTFPSTNVTSVSSIENKSKRTSELEALLNLRRKPSSSISDNSLKITKTSSNSDESFEKLKKKTSQSGSLKIRKKTKISSSSSDELEKIKKNKEKNNFGFRY